MPRIANRRTQRHFVLQLDSFQTQFLVRRATPSVTIPRSILQDGGDVDSYVIRCLPIASAGYDGTSAKELKVRPETRAYVQMIHLGMWTSAWAS